MAIWSPGIFFVFSLMWLRVTGPVDSVCVEVAPSFRLRAMSDRIMLLWSSTARCCIVIQEAELLDGLLPDTDDVVLGLADGGDQQVGDVLEDLADGITMVCCSHTAARTATLAANFVEPTVSGEMDALDNLLSLSNIQTSLMLLSFNRRFLGLDTECGDQCCEL